MVLECHEGGVSCVAISMDGKVVVSGSTDNTVRVWDAQDGTAVGAVGKCLGMVRKVKFRGKDQVEAVDLGGASLWMFSYEKGLTPVDSTGSQEMTATGSIYVSEGRREVRISGSDIVLATHPSLGEVWEYDSGSGQLATGMMKSMIVHQVMR